jgi:hypothetical protein
MPLFLCRWPNGDCSVVLARTRNDAIARLDQVGNAENCPITPLRSFQVHFALTDDGDLALEQFGDDTREEVIAWAYPLLEHALSDAYGGGASQTGQGLPPDRRAAIARAVERERSRLDVEKPTAPEPQTELGRDVKNRTDMPTVLVDRLVRRRAAQTMRAFNARGKPS